MDIKIFEKPVITKFACINKEEFELSELYFCLNQILETKENDTFGDYSLREYELRYPKTMDKLVSIGLVKKYTGSRMARLYCVKDKKAAENLLVNLYELDND